MRAKVKLNEQGQLTANEPSPTSFSILRMILPDDVVDTEATNCTARGTLYAARCSRQWDTRSARDTSPAGFRMTKAYASSPLASSGTLLDHDECSLGAISGWEASGRFDPYKRIARGFGELARIENHVVLEGEHGRLAGAFMLEVPVAALAARPRKGPRAAMRRPSTPSRRVRGGS